MKSYMTSQFTSISLNFSVLDNFLCELGVNNNQIWPHMGQTSDFEQCSNRLQLYLISILVKLFMWIGANNDQIWLPSGLKSDFEKCSNRLQLDMSSRLVNLLDESGQIMARYDFLEAIRVILAMFEPTPTWPNFIFYFGQLFILIEANHDQINMPS